jgi:hypothetical protein
MEEILDLLGRYWWFVGIVILRVVVPMFKNKQNAESSSSSEKRSKPKSQLQEYLEKMRAEVSASEMSRPEERSPQTLPSEVPFSYDDESAFLGHPSVQQKPKPRKVKAPAKTMYDIVPEMQQPAEAAKSSLVSAGVETKSFPENLDYLPPMQRAFVFSEIFGSPKGLD